MSVYIKCVTIPIVHLALFIKGKCFSRILLNAINACRIITIHGTGTRIAIMSMYFDRNIFYAFELMCL